MKKELRDAKKVLKNLGFMLMAVRGKGGYKDRKQWRLTDLEFEQFYAKCLADFKQVFINIVVAEAMLQEPPPSLHSRWEEYQVRCKDVVAGLGKKK